VNFMCKALFAGALVLASLDPGQVRADEEVFLDRFRGNWIGSGRVQRNATTSPWQVNCTVVGQPGENRISIQGRCRAAVIIQRQIGADLTYDPRSGLYQGTYTGARVGPAQLTGRRSGDAVNLTIAWPKPVNGDTHARLVIRNEGNGVLRITVADNLFPGGPIQQTSDLTLRQE
jgi:hypothetical protein